MLMGHSNTSTVITSECFYEEGVEFLARYNWVLPAVLETMTSMQQSNNYRQLMLIKDVRMHQNQVCFRVALTHAADGCPVSASPPSK